eukprot:m51a1_g10811 putative pleckstrin domain-containing protein (629) ;mRNA; r:23957-28159
MEDPEKGRTTGEGKPLLGIPPDAEPAILDLGTPAARETNVPSLPAMGACAHEPSLGSLAARAQAAHVAARELAASQLPLPLASPPPSPGSSPASPPGAATMEEARAAAGGAGKGAKCEWKRSGSLSSLRRKDLPSKPPPECPKSPPSNGVVIPGAQPERPLSASEGAMSVSPSRSPAVVSQPVAHPMSPGGGRDRDSDAELHRRIKTKRDQVAREILTSERTYVEMIQLLIEAFLLPLKSAANTSEPIINIDRINSIFANVPDVLQINTVLLEGLESRMTNWGPSQLIGDLFLQLTPFLKLYSLYVANFDNSQTVLQQSEKIPQFDQFLQDKFADPQCRGQTLRSFLILPVQRIPRYRLLLQELVQNTEPSHPDYQNLQNSLEQIKTVAIQINEAIRIQENHQQMLEIQNRFNTPLLAGLTLVEPHRMFIREGVLWKVCRKTAKKRNVFLFNDWIVYASTLPTGVYKLHRVIQLETVSLADVPDSEKLQNAFQINSDKKSFVVYAEAHEDKVEWMLDITNAVTEVRQKHMSFQTGTHSAPPPPSDSYAAPVWQSDSDATECTLCGVTFTLINRRHHCRMCGRVACGSCTQNKMRVPSSDVKQRVCTACYAEAETAAESSDAASAKDDL